LKSLTVYQCDATPCHITLVRAVPTRARII
jgi:hypothetical protein